MDPTFRSPYPQWAGSVFWEAATDEDHRRTKGAPEKHADGELHCVQKHMKLGLFCVWHCRLASTVKAVKGFWLRMIKVTCETVSTCPNNFSTTEIGPVIFIRDSVVIVTNGMLGSHARVLATPLLQTWHQPDSQQQRRRWKGKKNYSERNLQHLVL